MSEDLKISVSGIRGVVGKSLSIDRLLGWVLTWERTLPEGPIVLGTDSRPHGAALRKLAAGALEYAGRTVLVAGLVPTPTVGVLIREKRAAGGLMLTASHNPSEWNAVKLFNSKGLILPPEEFENLLPAWKDLPPINSHEYRPGGEAYTLEDALEPHLSAVKRCVDVERIAARGFRIVVDGCRSVGGLALPRMLRSAGVEVVELDCAPDGKFTRGLEPTPQHLQRLCEVVTEQGADLGMAVDPDADRLALVSEKGTPVGEEYTQVLAADGVLGRGGKGVVTNVSSSRLVDVVAARHGSPVYRSKVGEPYVVALINETGAAIGGEGNGGVIFPAVQPGRDSLSGALLVLDLLARENKSLSEMISTYPASFMVKDRMDSQEGLWERVVSQAEQWWPDAQLDCLDGLKWIWEDRWVQLRPSNTEPILRIMAEAPSKREAQDLIRSLRTRI